MKLHTRINVQNQQWRHDPATGFTRCTAVILQAGGMNYPASEVGGQHTGKATVRLGVPLTSLADPRSLTSLEGVPVVDGHVWQTSETAAVSCGAIAGAPRVVGNDLVSDILVTDRETGRKIMARELEEISSAWDSHIDWTPGTDALGAPVDGWFSDIVYNHVALLRAGEARGGSSVRILNEETTMPDPLFTRVKLPSGRAIRVMNEDVPVLDEEVAETDKKVANAIDPAKLADAIKRLEEIQPVIAERDKLLGEVKAMKDQLDKLIGEDAVAEAADAMVNQRTEAANVMNAHGLKLEGDALKLRGTALRVHVINSVTGKALDETQAQNAAFVDGMFSVMNSQAAKTQVPPAGHAVAAPVTTQVENAGSKPDMNDPIARAKRMGHPVPKAN